MEPVLPFCVTGEPLYSDMTGYKGFIPVTEIGGTTYEISGITLDMWDYVATRHLSVGLGGTGDDITPHLCRNPTMLHRI